MQRQPVFFTSTFNILAHIHKVATCVFVVALRSISLAMP